MVVWTTTQSSSCPRRRHVRAAPSWAVRLSPRAGSPFPLRRAPAAPRRGLRHQARRRACSSGTRRRRCRRSALPRAQSSSRRSPGSPTIAPRHPSSARSSTSCVGSRRAPSRSRSRPASFASRGATTRRSAASRASCAPSMTRAASLGYHAWLEARAAADFEILRPHLERRLALTQEYVACHEPFDDPYDVLLDDHERGMRTADVAAIFARLKAELVPLVAGIGSRSTTRASKATSRRSGSGSSPSRCSRAGGWTTRRGGSTTPSIPSR